MRAIEILINLFVWRLGETSYPLAQIGLWLAAVVFAAGAGFVIYFLITG